jgi:glycosyltransferase involved in cell wall biosynthesis
MPSRAPGIAWPRISIVIPSLNQWQYLEQTLRSILLQNYPELEILLMDGGSCPRTLAVISRYEKYLTYWCSDPNLSQSQAINRGMSMASGDLLAWQNSDDIYEPEAFWLAAQAATQHLQADVIYGSCRLIDAASRPIGSGRASAFDLHEMLPWANMYNQSMFLQRRLWDRGYRIDESLSHYMDHEFFWRLILDGFSFHFEPRIGAEFRMHSRSKGMTQLRIAAEELFALYCMLYRRTDLPMTVRQRVLQAMRGHCMDQFGKSRWDLFYRFTREMREMAGWRSLGPALSLRRLITCGGPGPVQMIRRLKHPMLVAK